MSKPFLKSVFVLLILLQCTLALSQSNDSAERQKRRALFAEVEEISSSDFLASIEKANETMNLISNRGEFSRRTVNTFKEITSTNSSITTITQNIKEASNTNVRNQRMYEKVLLELQEKLEASQKTLNDESDKIVDLRKDLRAIIKKDTIFRKLVRDSVLRSQFKLKLKPLRAKFFATDSILKANLAILNTHKSETTNKKMIIDEALVVVDERLDRTGISMFENECANLWDSKINLKNQSVSSFIAEKFSVEIKAFGYYFGHSLKSIFLLTLFIGLVFWWTRQNLRYVRASDKINDLTELHIGYLTKSCFFPVLVVGLNIAITLNLYAPALYIEFLHLLLLLTLTILFYKKWPAPVFRRWLLLVAIFIGCCFIDLFLKVTLMQRLLFLFVNVVSIRFGWVHVQRIREKIYLEKFLKSANFMFIGCNILAIIFNVFGRMSLASTLTLAAVIALTQMIALSALLKIILEIITLQMYTIRLKRGITKLFEYESFVKSVKTPFILLILYLWVIIVASNLNLSDNLSQLFVRIFDRENNIGSFKFTIGGIVLFLLIIWIAHLLQKLVAYFFGEIDQENQADVNKRQYSKLLITRLVLLVTGYLLAISASGMPIDKITIILGALGVGVGLGLQSIVNNFVSGVILIFERPIQIGDVIESGSQSGRVKEIGLRTTKIDTENGAEVIIPNGSILSNNIINWTITNNHKLTDITFRLTGDLSIDEIKHTITSVLNVVPDVVSDIEYDIYFHTVGSKSHKIKIAFWCNIYRLDHTLSTARMLLFEAFEKRGAEMKE